MARQKRKVKALPTIWEVSDGLWSIIQTILDELDPPSWTGRDRIDQRAALNGIIYQMRSGCQWNHLPKQFGDDSSVHRTFQRWVQRGVLERVWATLVEDCEELSGVELNLIVTSLDWKTFYATLLEIVFFHKAISL